MKKKKDFLERKETLTQAQKDLWKDLAPSVSHNMVLYGGTAIALHLGHRASVDFDFFQKEELNKEIIRNNFSFMKSATTIQDSKNTLVVSVPSKNHEEDVKVSFFGGIDFGKVNDVLITNDGIINIASLDDLMATKLKTIMQRVETKDYIDIAVMIENGVDLAKGLAAARLIFGRNFQPSECLKALTYFVGEELTTLDQKYKKILKGATAKINNLPQVSLFNETLKAEHKNKV